MTAQLGFFNPEQLGVRQAVGNGNFFRITNDHFNPLSDYSDFSAAGFVLA